MADSIGRGRCLRIEVKPPTAMICLIVPSGRRRALSSAAWVLVLRRRRARKGSLSLRRRRLRGCGWDAANLEPPAFFNAFQK